VRDVPRIKSSVDALVRNYDEKVDKALVLNSLASTPPSQPPSATRPSTPWSASRTA
jgi:hypothetical protein